MSPSPDLRPFAQMRWRECRNDSGEEVPAFAVLRVTGSTTVRQQLVLTVSKPNAYGSQGLHAVNGPQAIASGKSGVCTFSSPAPVLYDTGDGTPAVGERWGPRDSSWKLRKNTGGFQISGSPDSTSGVVLAVVSPMLSFVGKTDSSHSKGSTGTISIYSGALGSESDTGVNMTGVYNRFANVASAKWVRCHWNQDGQQWELVAAEC
jgi:hypothetical protein